VSTMVLAQAVSCLVFPAVARWLCARFKPLGVLGPVVLCYAAGILAANSHLVPVDEKTAMSLNEASVALAIPLLLFSNEVKKWLSLGPTLLGAFGLACLSAVAAAAIGGFVFRSSVDEWWKVAGMLVGVYVGGTANLNAIGIALEARSETFVLLNAADVVIGGALLLVLLTVAQRALLLFMKPFPAAREENESASEAKPPVWTVKQLPSMVTGIALALACVLVSAGASMGLLRRLDPLVVMVVLTTLGIALSLVDRVRLLPTTAEVGEYLLLVFCVAVGSLADVTKLSGASTLFFFVLLVVTLAITFHVALCWLFRIDADSTIVTSTAAIFGPAFIPPVTAALKNKALLGPGLTLGLAGFAIGTYVGLLTAWGLRSLGGG
jgi:uncharacterized membrane protein